MFRSGFSFFLSPSLSKQRYHPLSATGYLYLVLLALLPIVVGCSQTPDGVAEVSGVVILDQEPLENAVVTFLPIGGGRPSTGKTDPSGNYRLVYTRDAFGALTGEHNVEISTIETQGKEIVPAKYNSKSKLSEQVEPGSNEINFDLSTQ